jgi:hypothetical protein
VLSIVKHDGNERRMTVIVAAETIPELNSSQAKALATKHAAAQGVSRPGISDSSGTYPVDAEGNSDEDLVLGRRPGVVGYRHDFTVLSAG